MEGEENSVSDIEHRVVSVKRSSSVYQTTLRPGISMYKIKLRTLIEVMINVNLMLRTME